MSEVDEAVQEAELKAEKDDLAKLDKAVAGLEMLSRAFKNFASKEEIAEAEGRKCILAVSGLKTTKRTYFFEVTGASLKLVQPYTDYTTLIIAPLDSVLRVFKGIAAGDKWALTNERQRGKASFQGTHSLYDGYALSEVFKRFAELAKRYAPGGIDLGI